MKQIAYLIVGLFLIYPCFAQSQDALGEYALAQKCYHTLDKTSTQGWDRCARKFEEVASQYPNTETGTKALFSVAKIYQEKFDLTHNDEELQKAFNTYNSFIKEYPNHSLADDSLYHIALLRLQKEKEKEKAEKALNAILAKYPKGDMALKAQELLQKMNGGGGEVISAIPSNAEDSDVPTTEKEPTITLKEEPKKDLNRDVVVRTVVIDPGHGGDDPGAIGTRGTREADVALQISRKLAFKLKNDLRLNTYLTRTTNRTRNLEQRNLFANKRGADLFISIHANASESENAKGVQTFYLNNATNEASKRLANRENKANGKPKDLSQQILSTMLQNANTEESRDLARAVHKSLVDRLKGNYKPVKDLKVDSALFYVLVGSKSPSILVETSFITNPSEEKRLKDSNYQWTIADGIARGVKNYIESRTKLASSL
ncbi:MAG: hypothetical protein A3F82_08060 [Deltaproteobacteria bacterium RIFCSPLOWO2_12_FULL_44_12]|nr:MAG: hypothetical protein A2712_07210 [Deltaproteobacteria bacterium RIFCSPHIGHO2_01_FULL_43_49]OGQ15735.1 MAG: hypothetical protein A3D22_06000 [Deltaproteobacteria bacterium RIFCSPHIGHO2_02_FULL_44_53]OGQ28704.1 MAG: hypothetical protein A3D98_00735 [Deltaproteobacteria bacterium RIFCSPHIGHO2_12_FULL_44_21]OGQ32027.1 MAG: hypothetical protein A2979_02945 [Deltaproteobacteria bacterium RIFCSPLOWO2_01_FULL_45_74]OGQ43640.1 MAG: hypothetical protein A3I70_03460 [Deltaproteobacteria bacterium 